MQYTFVLRLMPHVLLDIATKNQFDVMGLLLQVRELNATKARLVVSRCCEP